MKKVLAVLMAFIFVLSLAACGKSAEEKALEQAQEELERSKKVAQDAKDNYDSLKKDVDDYNQALEDYYSSKK